MGSGSFISGNVLKMAGIEFLSDRCKIRDANKEIATGIVIHRKGAKKKFLAASCEPQKTYFIAAALAKLMGFIEF